MTTLTMKDGKRLDVIQRVLRRELTVVQAALVMGVSERQCYRIKARVKDQGVKGVIHGNRGRPCKYKLKDQMGLDYFASLSQGEPVPMHFYVINPPEPRLRCDTVTAIMIPRPWNQKRI
jgi:hypothetical protein